MTMTRTRTAILNDFPGRRKTYEIESRKRLRLPLGLRSGSSLEGVSVPDAPATSFIAPPQAEVWRPVGRDGRCPTCPAKTSRQAQALRARSLTSEVIHLSRRRESKQPAELVEVDIVLIAT